MLCGDAVRERPILFSGPMVRAILNGSKTQTRRVLGGGWFDAGDGTFLHVKRGCTHTIDDTENREGLLRWCPYGVPGDRLYVRESWGIVNMRCLTSVMPDQQQIAYRAGKQMGIPPKEGPCTLDRFTTEWRDDFTPDRWRPSIHMPHWASRLTLEVVNVRVERLNQITPADAIAEGIPPAANSVTIDCDTPNPVHDFRSLWDSINLKRAPWSSNPWVWAITFKPLAEPAETKEEMTIEN